MDPATIFTIVSLVIERVKFGYGVYQSVEYAKDQSNLQRKLKDDEIGQIADQLSRKVPSVSYSEWFQTVKLSMQIKQPDTSGGTAPIPAETNYQWVWMIPLVFVMLWRK